jgi:hypothetical protein
MTYYLYTCKVPDSMTAQHPYTVCDTSGRYAAVDLKRNDYNTIEKCCEILLNKNITDNYSSAFNGTLLGTFTDVENIRQTYPELFI